VDLLGSILCPAPWRVPTIDDIHNLEANSATLDFLTFYLSNTTGYYYGSTWDSTGNLYLWTSTAYSNSEAWYYMMYGVATQYNSYRSKLNGLPVRCVR
jgi:uncharacterized protein (TIGR02145 family)